jgi:hypothetical protein
MTGETEMGNAIFDQRNRFVLSGVYAAPFGFTAGGVATLAGGLPYNYTTGVTNSGDTGATTDRPVINGVVVGRDTGRGTAIYTVDPFIGKRITLGTERLPCESPRGGVQRAQSPQRRRIQRYLRQWRDTSGWLWDATGRHHQSVACAGTAVLRTDRILTRFMRKGQIRPG